MKMRQVVDGGCGLEMEFQKEQAVLIGIHGCKPEFLAFFQ